MSGHSHYATVKRQKELRDNARGAVFSKHSRAITIAAKTGGVDPNSNFKLRIAIDKAKADNMPKDNIDRAISKAATLANLEEVVYEGFGPAGVLVIVEAATDNRNRTNAEIRNLFEKNGGKVGVPGSVSFNFEPVGYKFIHKESNVDEQILKLIDMGATDVQELEDGLEVYMPLDKIESFEGELIQKPKNLQDVPEDKKESLEKFLENFDTQDDVQQVYTNATY